MENKKQVVEKIENKAEIIKDKTKNKSKSNDNLNYKVNSYKMDFSSKKFNLQ